MRLAFAGTPEFAVHALRALIDSGRRPWIVLTQPDRPAGRGKALQASPVKRLAASEGIEVWQPATLRRPEAVQRLAELDLDLMVVAAYGLILPPDVLAVPRKGCLNIHASLLPRWRGAAPIQRAIAAGDRETGITIMQMEAGLDTGPMLLTRATPIQPADTGASLHDRLAQLGGKAIVEALDALEAGLLHLRPQPDEGVTYAAKLGRDDAWLDFRMPAERIVDRVRAFDPVPGSALRLARDGAPVIKVWRAAAVSQPPADGLPRVAPPQPGLVLQADAGGLIVACSSGAVDLSILQKPGGRRLDRQAFLHGFPIAAGERFLPPETT